MEGGSLQYRGERGLPGLFIAGSPLAQATPYFELEITHSEAASGGGGPVIGLCSHRYPLDLLPGWTAESVLTSNCTIQYLYLIYSHYTGGLSHR